MRKISETPKSVIILTILQIITVIFMLWLVGPVFVEVVLEGLITSLGYLFSVFIFGTLVLMIFGPIGLIKYRSLWAYWLTIIIDIIYILYMVFALLAVGGLLVVFLIAVPLIFIIYLFIIRDHFK